MTFPSALEMLGCYNEVKTDKKLRSVEKQGFKLHVTSIKFQVCSICYLAMNKNSNLGGFFYHLFSVICGSLFFAVHFVPTFERLKKTFQFLK